MAHGSWPSVPRSAVAAVERMWYRQSSSDSGLGNHAKQLETPELSPFFSAADQKLPEESDRLRAEVDAKTI